MAREEPRVIDYDPFSHAVQEDPYPLYAALRADSPVHHNAERDVFVLSRHADVRAALRNPGRFSSSHGDSLDEGMWGPQAREVMSFIAMDAPEHTRVRNLVSQGFTPRRIAHLEEGVRTMARQHLRPFLESGEFDFAAAVADIPVHVISEMIGIPYEDRSELLRMSNLMVDHQNESGGMPEEFWDCATVVIAYFKELIAHRRRHPREDLASVMACAEIDGAPLSDDEIVTVIGVINVAGSESTGKILSNAWYQAWLHPRQREAAWSGGVGSWVEETLRHDNPAQLLARLLTEPTTLHGVDMPAGARVALLVSSANRDERVFDRAETFMLDRDPGDWQNAIPFGSGPHFCLGRALARLTTTVVLEELVATVRTYRVDSDTATYVHSPNLRGFASLPTSVTLY
jgi:cytochrome P450